MTRWPSTLRNPCIAAWAPAPASAASRAFSGSAWVGSGGSFATTAKSPENRRSLPMISGRLRLKFASSDGDTRWNSGIAIPSLRVPPCVTFRKTSTPCE